MCVIPTAWSYALNSEENKDYQTCFETAVKETFWISGNYSKTKELKQSKRVSFL